MTAVFAKLRGFLSKRSAVVSTLLGTGGYVTYSDNMRYKRMVHVYRQGNILCPFSDPSYECEFYRRPALEDKIRKALDASYTNEYYLVRGEVGSGKSRLLVNVVREMIHSEGVNKQGAPVYVLASQGKSFADTLGEALRFQFDENVNFAFYFSYLLGIQRFPSREEHHKAVRVLDAIEKSAYIYAREYGRPAVLVIDGVDVIREHSNTLLLRLQEKAKLWADANICKVVFVCNEEKTEDDLLQNSSNWSRMAAPIYVADLTHTEAVEYLTSSSAESDDSLRISRDVAENVYELVGGRMQHLTMVKQHLYRRTQSFDDIRTTLVDKEKEKFVGIGKSANFWKFMTYLMDARNKNCYQSDVTSRFSEHVLHECIRRGIVRLERSDAGFLVTFHSKLTESAVSLLLTS